MIELLKLPLETVRPDPNQPRKSFDIEEMRRLKNTLAEHGQIVPACVRRAGDGWMLVDGERRWRALQQLHAEQPADARFSSLLAVEGSVSEEDLPVVQYLANEQRVGHTPSEKAHVVEQLRSSGHSDDALPDLLGMTKGEYRYLKQFAAAPDWLKQYGSRIQIKRPVIDEETGEPKRDENGKVKTHAWTFDPLPLTHLTELVRLVNRLLKYDEQRFSESQGTHKPITEKRARRLAESALKEGWGVKRLKDEVDWCLKQTEKGDEEGVDKESKGKEGDFVSCPREVIKALRSLPREHQIASVRELITELGLKAEDIVALGTNA